LNKHIPEVTGIIKAPCMLHNLIYIIDVLWSGMVRGDLDVAASQLIATDENELYRIAFSDRNILFRKKDQDIPFSPVDLCLELANELWEKDNVKVMRWAVNQMQDVVEELETKLERLVLRPHILKTKCSICPA